MTEEALRVATAAATFPPGCKVELVQADMRDYARDQAAAKFDVVMSSYAIHHLTTEGKAALLRDVFARLAPGGALLWGDVYNNVPGSSREEVMRRWQAKMGTYDGMAQQEQETIWEHASQNDLPEDLPTVDAMLKDAGFQEVECTYTDDFYAAVWVARKAA